MSSIGSGGLTGRPSVRPPNLDIEALDADGNPLNPVVPSEGMSLPAGCLRVLISPLSDMGCPGDCYGRQPDGTCLAEIIRSCQGQGIEPEFEVDPEGYWKLIE